MIPDPHQPEGSRPVSVTGAQKGAGLPLAIFLITVLALITVTITQLQQSTGEMEALDTQSSRAYYAAQSGIQGARTKINNYVDDECASGTPVFPFTVVDNDIRFDLNKGDLDESLADCDVKVCSDVSCSASVSGTCSSPDIALNVLKSTGSCGSGQDSAERTITID